MRQFKLFPLIFIFALSLSSCDPVTGGSYLPPALDISLGEFWAQNFTNSQYYVVYADPLVAGQRCNIWAERGSGVSIATAQSVADQYDTVIYPKMMATFGYTGNISVNNGQYTVHDTMELADLLGDGDGKLCILLLDIKDGYRGNNDPYTAGYFWSGNFLNIPYSNKCDMIYIDTNPGKPGSTASNATLAHEMQHLMNFVSSYLFRTSQNRMTIMDTWIDEGLSTSAEWLYTGQYDINRYNWYSDTRSLIQNGNNFFVWGNHSDNQYAILDDYASVYLFFQWLRLQSGSTAIYDSIITSSNSDFNAVTNAAAAAMPGQGYDNWGTLLKTWLAASYINTRSGKYGYMDDSTLGNIKFKTTPVTSFNLAPGEGVFSLIKSPFNTPNTGNINYVGLTASGLNEILPYTSGALLTVDTNSNNGGKTEKGIATGNASVDIDSGGRSLLGSQLTGPFPISAADMLRKNGLGRQGDPGLPRLPVEILGHE